MGGPTTRTAIRATPVTGDVRGLAGPAAEGKRVAVAGGPPPARGGQTNVYVPNTSGIVGAVFPRTGAACRTTVSFPKWYTPPAKADAFPVTRVPRMLPPENQTSIPPPALEAQLLANDDPLTWKVGVLKTASPPPS